MLGSGSELTTSSTMVVDEEEEGEEEEEAQHCTCEAPGHSPEAHPPSVHDAPASRS
jgi:hypothetical protein